MTRASGERVMVKLLPVASFNVPCHQADSRRLRMGQRSPVVEIVAEGAREKRDTWVPGSLSNVVVWLMGVKMP